MNIKKISSLRRLASVALLGAVSTVVGHAAPLLVTSGFNQDVIANGSGTTTSSTTATMDGGYNLYDSTYASSHGSAPGALPSSFTGTSGNTYTLASAIANNDLLLGSILDPVSGVSQSGTLSFGALSGVTDLNILGTSTQGSSTLAYQLNFSNGGPQTGTISYGDWFGSSGESPALGRANATGPDTNFNAHFYLYDAPISVTDPALILTSITFTYSSGANDDSTASIFALSEVGGTPVPAVPEPGSLALLAVGGVVLLGVRRFWPRKA